MIAAVASRDRLTVVDHDAGRTEQIAYFGKDAGYGFRVCEIALQVKLSVVAGRLLVSERPRCRGDSVPFCGKGAGDVGTDVGTGAEDQHDW